MSTSAQPFATSYATPASYKQRKEVPTGLAMPGIVIFVHGVNSEGEWYGKAETHLLAGLNKRLRRTDLKPRLWNEQNAAPKLESSDTSPVIHFFWGYRAPNDEQRKWKVPLRDTKRENAWAPGYDPKPPLYWGGGPFQNGCNNLPLLWSEQGFRRRVWAAFLPVDVQWMNPEVDRQLQDAPARTYYAHAAGRLADLVRKIRGRYPADTITLMTHSQGTQIALGAIAVLETDNQPDAVILMNGPYALESKTTDSLAQGNAAPTERARRQTFENLVRHFQQGKRPLTPEIIDHLQVGTDGNGGRWTPRIENERDNTGRMYVYFSPHDRVMGATALQSMGWQGLPKDLLDNFNGTLYQRMLARTTPCGGKPAEAYLWPRDLDGQLKPFWDEQKKTKGLVSVDIWSTPDKEKKVWINAEKVPAPIAAEEMVGFDADISSSQEWETMRDYPFFRDIYDAEAYVTDGYIEDELGQRRPYRRLETQKELEDRIGSYIPTPTDHSSLPAHEAFISRVVAYDLPIGLCQSHQDKAFWAELNRFADWRIEGADAYMKRGQLNIPSMPRLIETETFGDLQRQRLQTQALWDAQKDKDTSLA